MKKLRPVFKCLGGCGRVVSRAGDVCLSCGVHSEKLAELKKENPVENCTHIIVKHNEGGIDTEDLYRANGMLCASRQKDIVRFGTDISTAQNRPFLNAELASKFLRVMAEVDLEAQKSELPLHEVIDTYVRLQAEPKAIIDERNIEQEHSGLVLPASKRFN